MCKAWGFLFLFLSSTSSLFAVGEKAFRSSCRSGNFSQIIKLNENRIRGANYPKLNTLCLINLFEEQHASHKDFPRTMNYLLHRGADPNGRNQQGETIIQLALNAPPIILERLFLAGARIESKDPRERSYFHLLIGLPEENLAQQMKVLIDEGVSLNQRDRFGRTPLYMLAQYLELGLIEESLALEYGNLMMSFGARQNIPDWEGRKPSDICKNRSWQKLLIDHSRSLY